MLQQLGHQLERVVVGFLVGHPHAVRRVKQRDLRRRPANCQQVLGAADIPADFRAIGGVEAADIHVVDAADELVIHDEFPFLTQPAALFIPDQRTPGHMGRRRGQLGKISHDARPDLVEIIHSGHADITHVAPEGAFVFDQVSAARHHQLFMIQMDHEFHVARLAPVFHALVEIVAKHSAPHVPVIRPGALRFGRQPAAAEEFGGCRV